MPEACAKYPSLNGKTVFVTGGATGIGAALVRAFVAQGCAVGFLDCDQAAGEALVSELVAQGALVRFEHVDVTQVASLRAAIRQCADTLGDITVLVNNVGNDQRFDPRQITPDQWRASMAVNLDPAFFAAQTVYPMMAKRGGGSIVNLSSINALFGPPQMPSYNTAKAALLGLTKSLAQDFGRDRIRVNAVLPGWVITERQLDQWLTPEIEAQWMRQVMLPERLLPDDVARMVLFLAAEDSRLITSQNFIIDGGRL
ncbi:SDR family NAD(P)-dependent oxidoreductase [Marinimicrobium alkaliphilum]|uniref:SDR family NAD(P)-dependent oxidoreductase n=1 Tax=Marinimicrobium alkaliphilum TaxID=2202654 RepID=UPI000DBA6F81|nr:SDR family NAD(P)-dependent oxidoreductase [Marinimicrobium alkaliphilum]